jgi:D-glycero-alpha-D-manno-heptose-7-phosphate kinase
LAAYCDTYGGAVLNVTIGQYAYAHLTFRDDHRLCFEADDVNCQDMLPLAAEVPLDEGLILHRAVFNRMARDFLKGRLHAFTIRSNVDAPPGSGLGSSSALVVALIEAFRTAFRLPLGPYDVARLAFEIERLELGLAGGQQDHYAAAFGGMNFMEFLPEGKVIVNPLRIPDAYLCEFEASLLVCSTGQSRTSETIIRDQLQGMTHGKPQAVEAMHRLKSDAIEMKQALLRGDINWIAKILQRSWQAKRQTSDLVSNSLVERILEVGLRNGAIAGKVSGAGGGGFVMFIAHPERRYRLVEALTKAGNPAIPIQFTSEGAKGWMTEY